MPNLLRICLGIAAIAGIVSVSLWRELRAEQHVVEELRAQLANAGTVAASPDTRLAATPPQPSAEARIDARVAQPANMESAGVAPARASVQRISAPPIPERTLLKDPAYRNARIALLKLNMHRQYPGVAEELGLSDAEAEALFGALAENQLERNTLVVADAPQVAGQPSPRLRASLESAGRLEARIASLLGDERYAKWEDYRNTRLERVRVASMSVTLVQAGVQPLSPAQTRALNAVMQNEMKLRNEASWAKIAGDEGPEAGRLSDHDQMVVQADSNRRILAAAAPLLNPAQLAALRTQFEEEDASRRANLQAQVARAAPAPDTQPAGP